MPPPLRVTIGANSAGRRDLQFTKPFRIGRVEECEVCIKDEHVSRAHAELTIENGQWRVRDLRSSNGIFVDGERTDSVPLDRPITVRLGIYGPSVSFEVERRPRHHPSRARLSLEAKRWWASMLIAISRNLTAAKP